MAGAAFVGPRGAFYRKRRGAVAGASGTDSVYQRYELADAVDSDGRTIMPGGFTASTDEVGFMGGDMATGVNAATIPAMAYVEWELLDAEGAALADVREIDILSALVQFLGAQLPTGARIGVALTVGGMAAATKGIAGGIQGSSNGVVAWHAAFAAAWSAPAVGSAADYLATTGQLQTLRGNSNTNLRISTSLRLPDDEPSKDGSATTTPLTSSAGGPFDRIALLIGNTAAQGAVLSVMAGIKSFLRRISEITHMSRLSSIPAPAVRLPSDGYYGVVCNGHSMMYSTVVGNQAGTAVNASWEYYNLDGLTDATWDLLSSPGHSICAVLADEIAALNGGAGGYIVRRAASGAALAATTVADGHLGASIYDVENNGLNPPDLVILWYGANDSNGTEQQSLDYEDALRRHVSMIRERYPNAIIVLPSEHTTTPGTYVYLANIEAAKVTIAAEFEHVYHVIYDYQTAGESADGIHPNADGYDAIAANIVAFLETITP